MTDMTNVLAPSLPAPPPEPLWDWSPQAVTRFFKVAYLGGRKTVFLREGMNAALLEDFPRLVPALARFWIETLAKTDALKDRVLTVTHDGHTFRLPITEALLLDLCQLTDPEPEIAA